MLGIAGLLPQARSCYGVGSAAHGVSPRMESVTAFAVAERPECATGEIPQVITSRDLNRQTGLACLKAP